MKAFLADLGLTAVFVAIGMSSHEASWSDYPLTLVPFVIALTVAWVIPRVSTSPVSLVSGAIVWAVTAAGGLGLRSLFGDGVSGAFPIVTAIVLAAFFFGWRIIVLLVSRRSHLRR